MSSLLHLPAGVNTVGILGRPYVVFSCFITCGVKNRLFQEFGVWLSHVASTYCSRFNTHLQGVMQSCPPHLATSMAHPLLQDPKAYLPLRT